MVGGSWAEGGTLCEKRKENTMMEQLEEMCVCVCNVRGVFVLLLYVMSLVTRIGGRDLFSFSLSLSSASSEREGKIGSKNKREEGLRFFWMVAWENEFRMIIIIGDIFEKPLYAINFSTLKKNNCKKVRHLNANARLNYFLRFRFLLLLPRKYAF